MAYTKFLVSKPKITCLLTSEIQYITIAQIIMKRQSGFTLIELLVVIGILAVLLAIVLVAINPSKQFGQANDTKRKSDVSAILNAIGAYAADNKGALPSAITTTAVDVGISSVCTDLVPNYISALPVDPKLKKDDITKANCSATSTTDYTVKHDADNRVTVAAPDAEGGPILVTR